MPVEQLKNNLTDHLFRHIDDLENLPGRKVAKVAEFVSKPGHNPGATFKKALSIVEDPTKETISPEELEKAAQLVLDGQAELEAERETGEIGQVFAESCMHGDGEMEVTRDQWKAAAHSRAQNGPKKTKKRTASAYWGFLLATRIRLFFLRADRVTGLFGLSFLANTTVNTGIEPLNVVLNAISQNLRTIWTIAGLSYFAEFFFDLGVMTRAALFPADDEEREKTPSGWDRFWNTYHKEGRPRRMRNALAWGLGNLACLIVSIVVSNPVTATALAAGINLFLFAFDVVHDVWEYYAQKRKFDLPLDLIIKEKKSLAEEIERLSKSNEPQKLANAKLEYAALECVEKKLAKEKAAQLKLRKTLLIISVVLFVGMVGVLMPQIFPAACFAIFAVKAGGASVAMLGSVVGGLGRYLFQTAMEWKNKFKKPEEIIKENLDGCDVFIAPPFKSKDDCKISDRKNVYLYKDIKGLYYFYQVNGVTQRFTLPEDSIKYLNKSDFEANGLHPVRNSEFVKAVLAFTSAPERRHTSQNSTPRIRKLLLPEEEGVEEKQNRAPNRFKRTPAEANLTTPEKVATAARSGIRLALFQRGMFSKSAPDFHAKKAPVLRRAHSEPVSSANTRKQTFPWDSNMPVVDPPLVGGVEFIDGNRAPSPA